MDRLCQQQYQLVPQVMAADVGQLVAEDEPQLPLPVVLRRQQQPGPEQPRRSFAGDPDYEAVRKEKEEQRKKNAGE